MTITTSGSTLTFSDSTTQTTAYTGSPIPSGSVMLFYQSAAPTGWTQVTTLNDYDLRLVSGTGGGTGGTTAYSSVFTNQTPTITTSGLSAGATTLSTAQIPSHQHIDGVSWGVTGFSYGSTTSPGCATAGDSSGGSSNSHAYTSFTGGGGSHSHSISGSASSSAITLNVRYANIIICSKN